MFQIKNLSIEKISKDLKKELEKISSLPLNSPNFFWWVVINHVNQKTRNQVGIAGFKVINKSIGYIGPTFVKQSARGHKLQLRLIKKRLSFAKKLGLRKVISRVDYNNHWSANNLIKAGFLLDKQPIVGKTEEGVEMMSIDGKTLISLTYPELYFVKNL